MFEKVINLFDVFRVKKAIPRCSKNNSCIRSITSSGTYEDTTINGDKDGINLQYNKFPRGKYFGLRIGTSTGKVKIKNLVIENVHVGLIKEGDGEVEIDRLEIKNYGGDAINIWGSNLTIKTLIVNGVNPTKPYNAIYTTDIKNTPATQEALKQCGEAIETKYLGDYLKWKKAYKNGKRREVEVNGIMKKMWISTEHTHVDACFQAYYKPFIERKSQNTINTKTITMKDISKMSYQLSKGDDIEDLRIQSDLIRHVKDFIIEKSPNVDELATVDFDRLLDSQFFINQELYQLEKQESNNKEIGSFRSINRVACNSTTGWDGTIKNITIKNINATVKGKTNQVIALTESCKYEHFYIGKESLDIKCQFPYWFFANTLQSSSIGVKDASINCITLEDVGSKTKLETEINTPQGVAYIIYAGPNPDPCTNYPLVKIGTGLDSTKPCLKKTFHGTSTTYKVTLDGVSESQYLTEKNIPQGEITIGGKKHKRTITKNLRDPST